MDQNKTLRAGDIVKYIKPNKGLDRLGFKLGLSYKLSRDNFGGLSIYNETGNARVVSKSNILTDIADYVYLTKEKSALPRGI